MNAPPILVNFCTLEELRLALGDDHNENEWADVENHYHRGYPVATSAIMVAALFGYTPRFVGAMMQRPSRYYRRFEIPKGSGSRSIRSPIVSLKVIQKWISTTLSSSVVHPSEVYGFVPGRSAVQAANRHCGADWVYSTDIENFFTSITTQRVIAALDGIGFSEQVSRTVARLVTLDDVLPQGSPASPVLSNIAFRDCDSSLVEIAGRFGATYTRYADDIVFSGFGAFPSELRRLVGEALDNHCWRQSKGKERTMIVPERLKVHGLLVHGSFPRLTKGYRNRIRAYRHLKAAGRVREADVRKIDGHLAYALSVDEFLIVEKTGDDGSGG